MNEVRINVDASLVRFFIACPAVPPVFLNAASIPRAPILCKLHSIVVEYGM